MGGAEAISTWDVAPLIQSVGGISPSLVALVQNVFHGLHCGLCEAVTLRVVRGRQFVRNVVLEAKFGEITAEMRAPVATDGRRSS